jgi:hypothetical protein
MDRELGLVLGSMLLRHQVASVPLEELTTLIARLGAWPQDVAGLLPITRLLPELIRPELLFSYSMDWDNYGHGLVSFEEILERFSAATGGEWAPADLAASYDADTDAEVVTFTFRASRFRWEISHASGVAVTELRAAISGFAAQHLTGRVFQGEHCWYLPAALAGELAAFIKETSRTWPRSDQLAAIFRSVLPAPPDPGPAWPGIVWSEWMSVIDSVQEESSLERINDLASTGERPLHVLVKQTGQISHEILRKERLGVIADLIETYHADPLLRDAAGLTAFDHAAGAADLTQALSTSPSTDPAARYRGLWFTDLAGAPAIP